MAVLVTDKIGEDLDSVCRGSASPSMAPLKLILAFLCSWSLQFNMLRDVRILLYALVAECLIFW